MKKFTFLVAVFLFTLFSQHIYGQNYDYLKSVTATGNGVTTDNSQAWSDLFSVSIDVTDVSYVLVTASINMRTDGANTSAREANYNIYRSDNDTDESGIIKRQMKFNTETGVESWGIGTLVHVFDASGLSGTKTYTLEHANNGGTGVNRNVYSSARLTAVALSTATNHYELSNDVKRIGLDATTTTSSTYEAVAGLTTDAIELPIKGDIFVTASINGKANADAVAEYKLQYSTDDGSSWLDLGKPVKRSMINTWDDGIVSLVGLLQNQGADNDFKFRVAHKRESGSGTVTTHNSNLAAIALAHSGGGFFPSFYSDVGSTGVEIVGLNTTAATVTSSAFTAAADISSTGTNLFVNSQYLVSASNLNESGNPPQRMRAGNQLIVSGASSGSADEYYRYIPDNSNFGAGGFIGLMEDLVSNGNYTIKMQHQIEALPGTATGSDDETLTTSEVILAGFQTYDQPGFVWEGTSSTAWGTDANWAYEKAPSTSLHDATIPNVTTKPVIDGATRECNDLFILTGSSLTVEDEGFLTVHGDLHNSGTLTVKSTATSTGSLIIEGTTSDNVAVQRFLTHDRWHYISGQTNLSGVGNYFDQLSMGMTGGADKDQFYRWEEGTVGADIGVWVDILNGNGSGTLMGSEGFVACKGYGINYITTDKTLSLSGVPYTTSQSIDITKTAASTKSGSNLVGNPFTSTIAANISANSFLSTNTDLLDDTYNGIYLWNEKADYIGNRDDYKTISNVIPAAYIAPGQAFMIVKKETGTSSLPFNTNMQEQGGATFYKNTTQDDVARLYVSIENNEGLNNEILIGFLDGMTDGLDISYDVGKLKGNPDIALYTKLVEDNGADFAHQALPNHNIEDYVIPVGVDVSESGVFEFSATQENLDNYSILLEDRQENTFTDLRWDTYFTTISESGTGRFYLHFKDATSIDETTPETKISFNFLDGKILINNPDHETGTISLINMSGQVLTRMEMNGDEKQEFSTQQTKGIYIISIATDKSMINRKAYIH